MLRRWDMKRRAQHHGVRATVYRLTPVLIVQGASLALMLSSVPCLA